MSGLNAALRHILGAGGLLDAPGDIAGYRGDLACPEGSDILGVVRPRTTAELAEIAKACMAAQVAMVARGGGTGLAGGATPVGDAPCVLISFERMHRIRSIDTVGNVMIVEAGCPLQQAQAAAAEAGRLLGLDHGGAGSSQIGGNLATNAGGNNVLRYGMAREQVLGLEAVLADGTLLSQLQPLRKNNSGYDLKQLFIGAEGTLGLITAAALRLRPAPVRRTTACVGLSTPEAALALLARAQSLLGEAISAFELLPRAGLDLHFRHVGECGEPFEPSTPWVVLIEADSASRHFDLDAAISEVLEGAIGDGLVLAGTLAASEAQRQALWRIREGIAVAMIETPGALKSDTSVPIAAIPAFIAQAAEAVARVAPGAVPVPFGHVGDGNIHFNVLPPPKGDLADFRRRAPAVARVIEDISIALGGAVSAEHGIGLLKRDALRRMRSTAELDLMRALKRSLDPSGLLNPGKILEV
jgi:FAD/FMN-containing dehydrogenase